MHKCFYFYPKPDKRDGFTIVELLIAIVVIAILATITIVAFYGMQERAIKSSLTQALSNTVKRVELDKVTRSSYAPSLSGLQNSTEPANEEVSYQYTSDGSEFCVTATMRGIAMHASSSQTEVTDGACSGHDAPINGPITDPVVYTQTGSFNTGQPASGGLDVPITVNYDLQATDYVFVLFNAHYRTNLTMRTATNSAVANLYDKSMGSSGYQRHTAFGIGGLSGQQTLTANACWSMSCTYEGATVRAGYIVYVIRGLGASPTVASTYTPYGVDPGYNATVSPAAQQISAGDAAIFSYAYYGNTLPTTADASSPSLSWTVDSTAPGAHLGTAIAAWHTYAHASTSVTYQNTMPASGTLRHGSVLFTFK